MSKTQLAHCNHAPCRTSLKQENFSLLSKFFPASPSQLKYYSLLLLALLQLSAKASAAPQIPLPDTTNGIHVGQVANYNITDLNTEAGLVDFVWGSDSPTEPTGVYNTAYMPFDREPWVMPHDLNWFLTNHPDWIVYQDNGVTPAYMGGSAIIVPLDIGNPDVRDVTVHRGLEMSSCTPM